MGLLIDQPKGFSGKIKFIKMNSSISQRFLELGLGVGDPVKVFSILSFGGPIVILTESGIFSLRRDLAALIEVEA